MPHSSADASTDGTGIARSVLQFSVPACFAFVINIVSAIIITRQLEPDSYGPLNTSQASTTLFVFLVCVGLDNGFLRYFYESPLDSTRTACCSSVSWRRCWCSV